MKVFDLDKYLVDSTLEVKLNGKSFKVSDIPYGITDALKTVEGEVAEVTEKRQKEALTKILKCAYADLDGYGLVAVGAIIREITENLFQKPSQEPPSQG